MAWTGNGNHRFENWAIAVLTAIVALIATYAVLTRPDENTMQNAEFERLMPDDYEDTLSALIRAGGQACDKVCSASITEPSLGTRQVHVSCAVASQHVTCAQALEFEISVAPAPQPSR